MFKNSVLSRPAMALAVATAALAPMVASHVGPAAPTTGSRVSAADVVTVKVGWPGDIPRGGRPVDPTTEGTDPSTGF